MIGETRRRKREEVQERKDFAYLKKLCLLLVVVLAWLSLEDTIHRTGADLFWDGCGRYLGKEGERVKRDGFWGWEHQSSSLLHVVVCFGIVCWLGHGKWDGLSWMEEKSYFEDVLLWILVSLRGRQAVGGPSWMKHEFQSQLKYPFLLRILLFKFQEVLSSSPN